MMDSNLARFLQESCKISIQPKKINQSSYVLEITYEANYCSLNKLQTEKQKNSVLIQNLARILQFSKIFENFKKFVMKFWYLTLIENQIRWNFLEIRSAELIPNKFFKIHFESSQETCKISNSITIFRQATKNITRNTNLSCSTSL